MKYISIILIILLMVTMFGCSNVSDNVNQKETTTVESSENKIEIDSPYIKVLNDYYDANGYMGARYYAFHDFDKNGTDELVFGIGDLITEMDIYSIYTITDGVAVLQDEYPEWMWEFESKSLIFEDGTIRYEDYDMTEDGYQMILYGYFKFENGKLERKLGISSDSNGGYYRINPETEDGYFGGYSDIPKEEYYRLEKEIEGDKKVINLEWNRLDEYKPIR